MPIPSSRLKLAVILACAFFLLRELGPILRPLLLAVLLAYVILPVHLAVKRWVPGRLSLAVMPYFALLLELDSGR